MMIIARLQNWRTGNCKKTAPTAPFSVVCSKLEERFAVGLLMVFVIPHWKESDSRLCSSRVSWPAFTEAHQKYFVHVTLLERNLLLVFRLPSDIIIHFKTTVRSALEDSPTRQTLKLHLAFHTLLTFILLSLQGSNKITVFQVQRFYFTRFF